MNNSATRMSAVLKKDGYSPVSGILQLHDGAHLEPGTAEVHVGVRERRTAMGLPNNTRRWLTYVYRMHATSPFNEGY